MNFWEEKPLEEMSDAEWESLCDGCAQCCMIKLEDEESGRIVHTAMVCDYLQLETCRCSDYPARHQNVPDCVELTPSRAATFSWLPKSCAYRTLAEGRPLAAWHPLLSGSPETVIEAGISVQGRVVPLSQVHSDAHEEMVITWVDAS